MRIMMFRLIKCYTTLPATRTARFFSAASDVQNIKPSADDSEIRISDNCVRKLKAIVSDDNFLRVSVEGGGCSGFQYKFELDNVVNEDDKVFSKDGMKVVVDLTSLDFLKGSTVDYHEELIRSAFNIMDNPIAQKGCSCGVSFSLKT